YSSVYLKNNITILMGGRVAEELVRGELTTGAGNDIERATIIARKMVCEWGMSEKMGPVTFGQKQEMVFLGRDISRHKDYSEATARDIDQEVRDIVTTCYERARMILKQNLHVLHQVSKTLLEKEIIDGAEIKRIIEGLVSASAEGNPAPQPGSPA
ncbi:MAG: cell division protein FtsH, partial [Deltaproteobacteria bacterium]|nr:cell division protein FtsH [Deltaproteobacteria bacterium]